MTEKNNKFKKPISGLILACFLVFLALGAGLTMAYFVFFESTLGGNEKEIKFHSAIPAELSFYENLYKFSKQQINFSAAPAAGVMPHHLLAGDLIAEFFSNLESFDYDTIVLIGPNHFNAGTGKVISSAAAWQTPYGVLPIDQGLLEEMEKDNLVSVEEGVLDNEHAVNAEVAFIKKTFPKAEFLPLILRSNVSPSEAENFARNLYKAAKGKKILLLSSTDFSHYKTSSEAQADDKNSLAVLENSSFDRVYGMAVDSPAATYVLMKYAALFGAKFTLLRNSNSALLADKDDLQSTTSYITGYFSSLDTGAGVLPAANTSQLKFLFFGDLMLDRDVKTRMGTSGPAILLADLEKSGVFANRDLISANLEGAVVKDGEHWPPEVKYDFSFAPEDVERLKDFGFNFFNIANNHLNNQGENGIIETEKNLTDSGFSFAGCQDREVGVCTSKIVEKKGKNIGLAGASMVYGKIDEAKFLNEIRKLASTTDLVVVQMHWGIEYEHELAQNQIALAHKIIEAGADMIIGHHPHVVGGLEIYQGRPIFYSLGNFIFDQGIGDTFEELGAALNIQAQNCRIELFPIISRQSRLRLMNEKEKKAFLEKIAGWSIGDEEFKKQIKNGIIEINN
jgi:AmmeMemoRadiSam system protein B